MDARLRDRLRRRAERSTTTPKADQGLHQVGPLHLLLWCCIGLMGVQVAPTNTAVLTTSFGSLPLGQATTASIGRQQAQQLVNLQGSSSSSNYSAPVSGGFKFKNVINDLLQSFGVGITASPARASGGNNNNNNNQISSSKSLALKQVRALHGIMRPASSMAVAVSSAMGERSDAGTGYKCAKYCTCSVIQVLGKAASRTNLTRARCESGLFSDLLTIDRRTQIIHISLPPAQEANRDSATDEGNKFLNNDENSNEQSAQQQQQTAPFRMPRLVQFQILREIVIINLKFEVCDSEVFKRGQRLRRFQLNHNQLSRISKACLRHLDKLVELNLDHNKLNELESALFSSLFSLRSLSIAHNRLSELAAHQFANLTHLVALNLVGNSFKTINLHLFEPMQASLRLLLLAKNEIRAFVYSPVQNSLTPANNRLIAVTGNSTISPLGGATSTANILSSRQVSSSPFSGVVFKNLIKLNVDSNRLERVKQLQLHRFFNVKFLSIRRNNIASIRDKAFNGLKLIELNLANNQLQTVTKCAFCNATIKRLVLAHNNISLPQQAAQSSAPSAGPMLFEPLQPASVTPLPGWPLASGLSSGGNSSLISALPLIDQGAPAPQAAALQAAAPSQQEPPLGTVAPPTSSQNMLILSQSLFGPLFAQLEYLDLSGNELLAEQLDLLLEPLLKLEYLNLASVGFDRSLPSPNMFKNLRQLRYLNLSHNQLDQLISETMEPLVQLEALDMSHNKFSELDESFLVTIDELPALKLINFGSNPWYCSQCKVAPLYDWILRSSIYNRTCILPEQQAKGANDESSLSPDGGDENSSHSPGGDLTGTDNEPSESARDSDTGLVYGGNNGASGALQTAARSLLHQTGDYSLLMGDEPSGATLRQTPELGSVDFDLIMASSMGELDHEQQLLAHSNYNLLPFDPSTGGSSVGSEQQQQQHILQLAGARELLASSEVDDPSIARTMASLLAAGTLAPRLDTPSNYCLRCEFPHELHNFQIHELSPGDFKFCAGAAPRFAASEPKIGLTLAIVIISALFCIIVVVIVMYRRKSNTYYTNEVDTEHLGTNGGGANGGPASKRQKQQLMSVSSDADHQYDATDYSSPPMSQSYDSSYSHDDDQDDEDEDEEYDDEMDEEEVEDEGEDGDPVEEEETSHLELPGGAAQIGADVVEVKQRLEEHPQPHHHHQRETHKKDHGEQGGDKDNDDQGDENRHHHRGASQVSGSQVGSAQVHEVAFADEANERGNLVGSANDVPPARHSHGQSSDEQRGPKTAATPTSNGPGRGRQRGNPAWSSQSVHAPGASALRQVAKTSGWARTKASEGSMTSSMAHTEPLTMRLDSIGRGSGGGVASGQVSKVAKVTSRSSSGSGAARAVPARKRRATTSATSGSTPSECLEAAKSETAEGTAAGGWAPAGRHQVRHSRPVQDSSGERPQLTSGESAQLSLGQEFTAEQQRRRAGASIGGAHSSGAAGHAQAGLRSSQTLYQVAAGLRSSQPSARPAKRPNFAQLERQRLAFAGAQPGGRHTMAGQLAESDASLGGAAQDESEAGALTSGAGDNTLARRAARVTHQERVLSPSPNASDATTADSLTLELALEFAGEPPEDPGGLHDEEDNGDDCDHDEPGGGGALVASQTESENEIDVPHVDLRLGQINGHTNSLELERELLHFSSRPDTPPDRALEGRRPRPPQGAAHSHGPAFGGG